MTGSKFCELFDIGKVKSSSSESEPCDPLGVSELRPTVDELAI